MTVTDPITVPYQGVAFDLYRDIHKGIRSQLFAVTADAGRLDPSVRASRLALQAEIDAVVEMLVSHAQHEDSVIEPVLRQYQPDLANKIETDHVAIEARMDGLKVLVADAVDAPDSEQRIRVLRTYIELASFTGAYLEHQDVEERVVMPALEADIGVEGVRALHGAIVGSIPPPEMAKSLAIMLPAMNVDDRTDLLTGLRAAAPAEAFAGVWGLVSTVLSASDYATLGRRLGLA